MFLYSKTKYAKKCFFIGCVSIFIPLATKQSHQSRQISILTIISINLEALFIFSLEVSRLCEHLFAERSCVCFQNSCFKPEEYFLSSTVG